MARMQKTMINVSVRPAIYDERLNQGFEFIAVAGDLNDTPNRDPLQPVLGNGSTLVDIMTLDDGRPGTFVPLRAGFSKFRRATQTPFNLVFEARP